MAIIKRDEFEIGRELLVQVRKRQLKAKLLRKTKLKIIKGVYCESSLYTIEKDKKRNAR